MLICSEAVIFLPFTETIDFIATFLQAWEYHSSLWNILIYKHGNTIPLFKPYSFTSTEIPFLSTNHTHLQAQEYHSPLWTILIYSECIYPVPRTSLEGWIIISLLLVCWSWQALSYESLTTFIFFLLNLQPCNLNMTSSCSAIIVSFIHLSQSLYSNR